MLDKTSQSRRKVVFAIGASVAGIPALGFAGCNSKHLDTKNTSPTSDVSESSTVLESEKTTNQRWASGGTKSLKAAFPRDALFQDASMCSLAVTGKLMEGPCYFTVAQNGDDISEGQVGLPMQLCLKVVDENCEPLRNAEVEVWHCDTRGVYSAGSSGSADNSRFATDFCSGDDAKAQKSQWFRGKLISDASGRVNFRSCLPGWYPGRCIHIHFRVRHQGRETLVSQLAFSDSLADEMYTGHPDYLDRGKQDTSVKNDDVFRGRHKKYLLDTAKNTDGSLLAYKILQLKT